MLFNVDLDKPVRETNPEIDTIREFKDIPDRSLKYVFLVYDYKSPYRELPMQQRKEKVALMVGFKMETGRKMFDKNAREVLKEKNYAVERARKAFTELIYDQDRDTYQAIDDLINNTKDYIRKTSNIASEMDKKIKMAKELPALASTKAQLAQILDISDKIELDEEDEESQVSTLEMSNEGLI
jgi:hypothetical protein